MKNTVAASNIWAAQRLTELVEGQHPRTLHGLYTFELDDDRYL